MAKDKTGVHPDRSGSMTNFPAISHHDSEKSSKSIRDTPEGRKIAKDWSKSPHSKD